MYKTTIVNVYLAGLLSTSLTLHTTVSFHFPSSCSSGYKNRTYRCRYVFFPALNGVLFSFPAPQYEYCLHKQSAPNSSGNNLCVKRTPRCPGLWLWSLHLSKSANDILCGSAMSGATGSAGGAADRAICCEAKCTSGAACSAAGGPSGHS